MKMKRIACVLIVVALVALGLRYETKVLVRKSSAEKFSAFYGEKANFDVLFLGNSHLKDGLSPLELWNEYGIASYNLALAGERMATSYWSLLEALRYTKPELVVIDGSYLSVENKFNRRYINGLFDSMPMSAIKLRAAFDIFDTFQDVFERVLFPFALYHSRWFELEENDFRQDYPNLMGYDMIAGAVRVERPQQLMAESPEPIQSINVDYLGRIIEECKARDIQVLLTYIPFRESEKDQNEAGYLGAIAKEHGLIYLTPTELASIIDWDADFRNGDKSNNSHLSHRGAKKLTRYIGGYIVEHYSLPDHRSEAAYAHWFDYYRDYKDYEDQELRGMRKWKKVLSLLGNERYGLVAAVGDPSLWADDVLAAQMRALGLDAEAVSDAPALYVAGLGATALRFEAAELAGEGAPTPLGRLAAEPEQGEGGAGYAVTLDGAKLFEALDGGSPLRIAVLDRETGGLVRSFGLEVNNEGKLVVADN